ncbi:MAG: hypothetical protein QOI78_7698, partial [Actinomycetota bacterium]|nr:hypothetical protein [Actinomycetota bacterium]
TKVMRREIKRAAAKPPVAAKA